MSSGWQSALEDYAAVMIGGALGATARWKLAEAVQKHAGVFYPWGTLTVNLLGSLLLGFIMGAAVNYGVFTRWERLLLATGFAGAFTTFSTFMYESLVLLVREPLYAAANIIVSILLGLVMVYIGTIMAGVVYG
ncbi:MAG: fluoride efflux transporter CrcB [Desulfurococcales archaeon]|nr:fluoride efflux transporter CrcB [Desulfurococcales archaeon]